MKNAGLFAKGKHHLSGAVALLKNKTDETVSASELDEIATLLLVSTRLFLRLAGRIDVPRPEPVTVVKRPRPKPVEKAPVKTAAESARRAGGRDMVFNVSMDMNQGDDQLGKEKKPQTSGTVAKESKEDRRKRNEHTHKVIAELAGRESVPKLPKKKHRLKGSTRA